MKVGDTIKVVIEAREITLTVYKEELSRTWGKEFYARGEDFGVYISFPESVTANE